MEVYEALQNRKSVRAFLDKRVEREKIKTILQYARFAPSGTNMQPWKVCVVSGERKRVLEERLVRAFREEKKEEMDYQYYPKNFIEPFKTRRRETGLLMYSTLGIQREEKKRMKEQWEQNYRSFNAPTVLYFFIDKNLETGSFLDYGMFLQSIVLLATEMGLGSCIQAVLAQYPSIVRSELNISSDYKVVCGIALGYEEKEALINSYRTPRISLEEFVDFIE